jgi:hypothetical protein
MARAPMMAIRFSPLASKPAAELLVSLWHPGRPLVLTPVAIVRQPSPMKARPAGSKH